MSSQKISVYDIEVYKNLFTCTFLDIHIKEVLSFLVSPWKNDWQSFVQHYRSHDGLIGFNCVDYDERVLHPFLDDPFWLSEKTTAADLTKAMYKRSGKVISEDFDEQRVPPHVKQRDLYRIWHFNNKARMTSLKYLQVNMGWKNVMESPIPFDSAVKETDVPTILDYNVNDVQSTFEFYLRSRKKINLRNKFSEKYGVNMGNFNDGKIGEAIFINLINKKTGRSERDIRSRNTPRRNIVCRDLLQDTIKFESKEFNAVLKGYRNLVITSTKQVKEGKKKKSSLFNAFFDGVPYDFGYGGLHACRSSGVYRDVESADVKSYYPNLSIKYKIYPSHLGPIYCEVYDTIYQERGQYGKGTEENESLKLTLNIPYGQSNAPWSIFYDPLYTMSITINGQLLLAMLCEKITLSGAGCVIMANTDGIEVDVKNHSAFETILKDWQKATNLALETSKFTKLCVRDVNNYVGYRASNEVKSKGDYELEKELHKDNSMKIVRQAVLAYFEKGTLVETTIGQCREIGPFLIAKRAKKGRLEYREAAGGELVVTKCPKVVRYYISKSGGSLVKITKATEKQQKKITVGPNQTSLFDDVKTVSESIQMRIQDIHSGCRETLFNLWVEKDWDSYNLDVQFYVREANKLINAVVNSQTSI